MVFLRDNESPAELTEKGDSTPKLRRSKRLVELNKKYNTKINRSVRPYLKNKTSIINCTMS